MQRNQWIKKEDDEYHAWCINDANEKGIAGVEGTVQCWGSGSASGSGSVCFWTIRIRYSQLRIRIRLRILPSSSKYSKKSLYFYCFVISLWRFSFEEWCKCTSVPNPHPNPGPHVLILWPPGSASGSVSQRLRIRGSGSVRYQNVTDPQHWHHERNKNNLEPCKWYSTAPQSFMVPYCPFNPHVWKHSSCHMHGCIKRGQELRRKNYKLRYGGEKSLLGAQFLHIENYGKFVN